MINEKIRDIFQLSKQIEKLKINGSIIALCHGVFDLLHLGHIKYFQEAKTFASSS